MDRPVLIGRVLAVAVVVAAIAAIAVYGGLDDDDGAASDYTLLGDETKVVKGLTVMVEGTAFGGSFESSYVVESVTGTTVTANVSMNAVDMDAFGDAITFDTFLPDDTSRMPYFDYVAQASSGYGAKVTVDGSTYILDGGTDTNNCKDLRIVYDPGTKKVTSVNGSMTWAETGDAYPTTYAFRTTDGKLHVSTSYEYVFIDTVEEFISETAIEYDPDDSDGTTVTVADGTYRGVPVKVYTASEATSDGSGDIMTVYVYNGYIIGQKGDVDGLSYDLHLSIFIR